MAEFDPFGPENTVQAGRVVKSWSPAPPPEPRHFKPRHDWIHLSLVGAQIVVTACGGVLAGFLFMLALFGWPA